VGAKTGENQVNGRVNRPERGSCQNWRKNRHWNWQRLRENGTNQQPAGAPAREAGSHR
jgi:hypothetical protein